ncbi:glutamine amidotransferase [Corynebacterium phocae]|uniref:Pyridoxal 5'-phosphate synthase subunit PdxT n=1 Tax=Corynebacterium phocae TaxID=161895 RepID=A0A1L7D4P7_9CORY|nr:pyridoxal 5'-phosphate synthase glutaminase subunit PdxT [Corynebacterium phocae]APT93156.1 glutamine amidotransferase [Corynebacterium phocae]KAA8722235.1 pyridoxal 5'-phosphate synthase glutaminase subunit PdxT [Corynebacterium phocae]
MIGVLALQGGVEEHVSMLHSLGAATRRVRLPGDLEGLDGLVLPGGESSVIDRLARAFGLDGPLREAIAGGLPVLATCAGLIYLARDVDNPAPGQQTLGVLDIGVRRNAFGNQRESAEALVAVDGAEIECSFIRAPVVTRVGPGVDVIARLGEHVVGVRQGAITALSFHPEENGDSRVHAAWVAAFA